MTAAGKNKWTPFKMQDTIEGYLRGSKDDIDLYVQEKRAANLWRNDMLAVINRYVPKPDRRYFFSLVNNAAIPPCGSKERHEATKIVSRALFAVLPGKIQAERIRRRRARREVGAAPATLKARYAEEFGDGRTMVQQITPNEKAPQERDTRGRYLPSGD